MEFLKNSSDKEYAKLSKFFKSSKYKKTTSELSKLLKNRAKGERANEPLASTASARLGKLHKRILKDGRNLSLQSQDESFHALRIDCKKIRYLLEFFEPLLEPSRAPEAIKLVKNLQTILGNYQDLSVQQHKIIGFADEMVKEQASIPSALLISIGVLVGDLQREQNGCKDKFLKSFEIFSKPQSKALFQALIETAQP